jgi:hypothetical protein
MISGSEKFSLGKCIDGATVWLELESTKAVGAVRPHFLLKPFKEKSPEVAGGAFACQRFPTARPVCHHFHRVHRLIVDFDAENLIEAVVLRIVVSGIVNLSCTYGTELATFENDS